MFKMSLKLLKLLTKLPPNFSEIRNNITADFQLDQQYFPFKISDIYTNFQR
jgi:hypothetical protein